MLKIISNYNKFINKDNIDKIIYIFELYVKSNKCDLELYDIIVYFLKYYYNNNDIITFSELKEKFSSFVFEVEDSFKDENEFFDYLKMLTNKIKKDYKLNLCEKYLSLIEGEKDKRIDILDELFKLESEYNESLELVEISEFKIEDILKKEQGVGIKTFVKEIDDILKVGVLPGKIMTIFAPPGSFKTTFALNMSYNQIMNYDNSNVLFLSIEIPKDELFLKFLVRHSFDIKKNINYLYLKDKEVDYEKKLLLTKEVEKSFNDLKKSKLYIIDSNDLIFDNLVSFKEFFLNVIEKYNLKMIYLDYIQLIMDLKPRNFSDVREWGNAFVGLLRYISVNKNCGIVLLSQANSDGINRAEKNNGKFSLTSISELNTIKNHSYYILSLYSSDDIKSSNQFKWQILKYRDGETTSEANLSYVLPQFYVMGVEINNFLNIKSSIINDSIEEEEENAENYF